MKYVYLIFIPIFIIFGCSSSDKEKMDKDVVRLKRTIDSIKVQSTNADNSLDSLQRVSREKEEKLIFLQKQLDSLNKNLEQEGIK